MKYSATPYQETLWTMWRLNPGLPTYNEAGILWFGAHIEESFLHEALRQTLRRFPVLLSAFSETAAGVSACAVPVDEVDYVVKKFGSRPEAMVFLKTFASRPFDLSTGPIVRFVFFEVGREHGLLCCAHHIGFDGPSFVHLIGDLVDRYTALVGGVVPELPFGDTWDRTSIAIAEKAKISIATDLEYWRCVLCGCPTVYRVRSQKERAPVLMFTGRRVPIVCSTETYASIVELGSAASVQIPTILLAGIARLLCQYGETGEIVIGVPFDLRARFGIEHEVGHFINVLPIRISLVEGESYQDFLGRIANSLYEAEEHCLVPLDKIVEHCKVPRHPGCMPLVQVVLNYAHSDPLESAETGELVAHNEELDLNIAKFDFTFNFTRRNSTLEGYIEVGAGACDPKFAELLRDNLLADLQAFATEPSRTVRRGLPASCDLALVQKFEPGPRSASFAVQSVWSAFSDAVRAHGNRTAVTDNERTLSYKALHGEVVHFISAVASSCTVAMPAKIILLLEPSVKLATAILGVLAMGKSYCPLDPKIPRSRLRRIIADSGAGLVVCDRHFDIGELTAVPVLTLPPQSQEDGGNFEALTCGDPSTSAPAYIIYTSGSTGTPKGAAVSYSGLLNLLDWYQELLGASASDKFGFITSPAFDLSQKNLILPFLVGASLHFCSTSGVFDPRSSLEVLAVAEVTILNCTPSMVSLMTDASVPGSEGLAKLRHLIVGGEVLRRTQIAGWRKAIPQRAIITNSYGPTECSDVVAYFSVDADQDMSLADKIPLGRAVRNVDLMVLDHDLQRCRIGTLGEICIGGIALGLGYLNDDELTRKAFIRFPSSDQIIYKTGDQGWWSSDGQLHFAGRNDTQVKVRGYRVDLIDIETTIQRLVGLSDVVADYDAQGDALKVYLIPGKVAASNGWVLEYGELRRRLVDELPRYMIPDRFFIVYHPPMNGSGKIDRLRIADFVDKEIIKQTSSDLAISAEGVVADIWRKILKMEVLNKTDNFFDLGGTSLQAVECTNRVFETFGTKVRPSMLMLDTFAEFEARCMRAPINVGTSTGRT